MKPAPPVTSTRFVKCIRRFPIGNADHVTMTLDQIMHSEAGAGAQVFRGYAQEIYTLKFSIAGQIKNLV